MMSMGSIPSACARKFKTILCLRTDRARNLTSSVLGVNLPLSTALALLPRIKNCEALGPTPHETQFFVSSGALVPFGLVALAIFTA